jgi:hypothetical protein
MLGVLGLHAPSLVVVAVKHEPVLLTSVLLLEVRLAHQAKRAETATSLRALWIVFSLVGQDLVTVISHVAAASNTAPDQSPQPQITVDWLALKPKTLRHVMFRTAPLTV